MYSVRLLLQGNQLHCTATPRNGVKKGDLFVFTLLYDGKKIKTTPKSPSNCYKWSLTDEGGYSVTVLMQRDQSFQTKWSNPVVYYDQGRYQDFLKFMRRDPQREFYKLDYIPPQYPYQDICVLIGGSTDTILSAVQKMGLHSYENEVKGQRVNVFYTGERQTIRQYDVFFSGLMKDRGKLINGCREIDDNANLEHICENIGEFSSVMVSQEEIHFVKDYFGLEKYYYFQDESFTLISNSYHLAVRVLSKTGKSLSLNRKRIIASFFHTGYQLQNNFMSEMDYKGIFYLPIDRQMTCREGVLQIHPAPIYDELNNVLSYDERTYEELLFYAKDELIENVSIALQHPSFDTIRVDLSGGIDSRLVYAAMTNCPDPDHKLKVYTQKYFNTPIEEIEIAYQINNIYNYPYDDSPSIQQALPNKNALLANNSRCLGVYFAHKLNSDGYVDYPKAAKFVGWYGEVTTRPYMSYQYLRSYIDGDCEAEVFFNGLSVGREFVTVYPNAIDAYSSALQAEFQKIPGRTLLEKYDLYYAYFRNGYHCNGNLKSMHIPLSWGVLQSKYLFRLKNMTFQQFKSRKLSYDIAHLLDPILGELPYANSGYNKEKERIKDTLYKCVDLPIQIIPNKDISVWQEGEIRRKANRKNAPKPENYKEIHLATRAYQKEYFAKSLEALKYIVNREGEEFFEMAYYLYAWMQVNSAKKVFDAEIIANRIFSIYYQMMMFEDPDY